MPENTLVLKAQLAVPLHFVPAPPSSRWSEEDAVLWITYCLFSLAALSCILMTAAFVGVFANRELSHGIFNASAIMSVVYTALSLVTGQLV